MNFLTRTIRYNKPIITTYSFYQNYRLAHVHEDNERSNYPVVYDRKPEEEKLNLFQQAKRGYQFLKEESKLYMKEYKEAFTERDFLKYKPNEVHVMWRFNQDPKCLDPWLIVSDSDYNQGYSTCKLELTQHGKAIFHGNLDFKLPKDGKIHNAGYCAIRTAKFRKSFKRATTLDWSNFNHLVMRIRGDGRIYMINIGTRGFFDITWHNLYNYVLCTRGGPYWQYVKIPFSKFIFSTQGRVQDKQSPLPTENITSFGIIASDKIPGPFKLEIDYIGVEMDYTDTEEFAYESYDNFQKVIF